jgi:hypothetical protein
MSAKLMIEPSTTAHPVRTVSIAVVFAVVAVHDVPTIYRVAGGIRGPVYCPE